MTERVACRDTLENERGDRTGGLPSDRRREKIFWEDLKRIELYPQRIGQG